MLFHKWQIPEWKINIFLRIGSTPDILLEISRDCSYFFSTGRRRQLYDTFNSHWTEQNIACKIEKPNRMRISFIHETLHRPRVFKSLYVFAFDCHLFQNDKLTKNETWFVIQISNVCFACVLALCTSIISDPKKNLSIRLFYCQRPVIISCFCFACIFWLLFKFMFDTELYLLSFSRVCDSHNQNHDYFTIFPPTHVEEISIFFILWMRCINASLVKMLINSRIGRKHK